MIRTLVAAVFAIALAACATARTPADPPAIAVVLVSIDGFRPADLGRGLTPHLDALARDGVRAEYMRPSYPSLTFPNHYTLVTGLRPDRHGIVHNTMEDEDLGDFALKLAPAVDDARWWGGEPIWATAEKAGIRSATMFWPGSSAEIGGVRPAEWRPYDGSYPGDARVDTVLGWLDRPAASRPRLVTLYFEDVDHAEHDHGPGSREAEAAISTVDRYIGRLREGLAARGPGGHVDIVVVSDHGMAPVPPSQVIAVEDIAPPEVAANVTAGQSVGFRPEPGREDEARRRLLGRHAHYECRTRESLPAHWHYGRHPRVPPIVCQMDEGWDAVKRAWLPARRAGHTRGSHGYDPALPSMRALFVADGPSFRDGAVVPAFDNVDVYPLLARLLGVTAQPNDGDPATGATMLRSQP
ncbi:MAG TPA: ectonucleotide pyrophosphatase/phosphodiesterase [Lysobacter sp.]